MAASHPLISHSGITEHLLWARHSVGTTASQPCSQKDISELVCELCVGSISSSSQLRAGGPCICLVNEHTQ